MSFFKYFHTFICRYSQQKELQIAKYTLNTKLLRQKIIVYNFNLYIYTFLFTLNRIYIIEVSLSVN